MARSLRYQYPGAFYHVMARGNARSQIFLDDPDRTLFLRTLAEACGRTGWRVHAWVLMGNHYHLVVQTPEPNLVAGMAWLQNAYTRRFNTRHRAWGRLFGDRYKAVPVEGTGYYYETLLDYVHLNPARAGLVSVKSGGSLRDYRWSSLAQGYALPPKRRTAWLAAEDGLANFGCADTAAGRRRFVARLDARALAEPRAGLGTPVSDPEADGRRSTLADGWYWGSQAFAERLLALTKDALGGAKHRQALGTRENRAHDEQRARLLLANGLRAARLTSEELARLSGSDPRKVALASEIWEQTTVSQAWLAEHLFMRSAANASQQIRRYRQAITTGLSRNVP
jgi:REP element-mobilizing transposase RayT